MSSSRASRRATLTLAAALAVALGSAGSASAHTVLAGESFWSIASANGLSASSLAAANGLSLTSTIVPGQWLYVPPAPAVPVSTGAPAVPGLVPVSGPAGTAYLPAGAAQNLASLRAASLRRLGVDVYPAGPLSGYRTYAQQAELYRRYLAGEGPLAAPPGTSEHEYGRALDVATPSGRQAVDLYGAPYGWQKLTTPSEWWHVNYSGG